MLPQTLKNFGLTLDGRAYHGRVEELMPPKLKVTTIDHKAGGMETAVRLDMGMEPLDAEFTLSEYNANAGALYGIMAVNTRMIFTGVLQQQGATAVSMEIEMRGAVREIDMGSWKMGDKGTCKFTAHLIYYKLTIAGRVVVEIDTQNMIRIIDGVDQLADQRAILGI